MKEIIFLRHAGTNAHHAGKLNPTMGFFDAGINAEGVENCKKMAEKLQPYGLECIISSDSLSAKQTAEYISQYLHIPLYLSKQLRERNQGEFTGKKLTEIRSKDKRFSITTRGKEREELRTFMKRTKDGFIKISNDLRWNSCLVISHKGFLRTMIVTCFGINPGNWYLCEMRRIFYDEACLKWIVGEQRRLELQDENNHN